LYESSRQSYARLSAKEKAEAEAAAAAAAAAAEAAPAEGDAVDAEVVDPALDPALEAPIAEAPIDPAMGGEFGVEGAPTAPSGPAPPSGEGWVIQLKGYHYHNTMPGNKDLDFRTNEGKLFVDNTLIKQLEEGSVQLPDGPNGELIDVPMEKLGIKYPVVTDSSPIYEILFAPEATSSENAPTVSVGRGPRMAGPGAPGEATPDGPKIWKLRRCDFTLQFYWKPTPRSERVEKPAGEDSSEFSDTAGFSDGSGPTG
jgi:hypothetical protein